MAPDQTSIEVINPATGQHVAHVPTVTTAQIDDAFARARIAQSAWAARPVSDRAAALRSFSHRLLSDRELPGVIMSETGKCRYDAQAMEIWYTNELTRFLCGRAGRRVLAPSFRHPFFFPNKRSRVIRHPFGVVGVIGPWNFPLLNNYADAVAPLLAGNAVLLKPSPVTPLTSQHVEKLWAEEGLPQDLFQVLPGGADVGAAVVERADLIFFTGSQSAGRAIAVRCADRLVPCILELGGKSAFVVLRDADPVQAARSAIWASFANAGQTCVRAERVIVDNAIADAFEEAVVEQLKSLRIGADTATDDERADIDVGAIIFAPQIARMERQIADAVSQGARVLSGGHRKDSPRGQFFEPTVLSQVNSNMLVAHEETFGPVMPILRARDADHALELANSVGRGLGGSVFSADPERALAFAKQVQTGSLCINDALMHYFCVESPLGGWNGAGLGHRHGAEALLQFTRAQTIIEDGPLLGWLSPWVRRNLLSFPYKTGVLRFVQRILTRLP